MLIKIKDMILDCKEQNVQYELPNINDLSPGPGSASIFYSFDIQKYPNYKKFFIDLWDRRDQIVFNKNKDYKIQLLTDRYQAFECFIKTMDISEKEIGVSFSCDLIREITLQERREGILDCLLNK